jgi:hypothetical protein
VAQPPPYSSPRTSPSHDTHSPSIYSFCTPTVQGTTPHWLVRHLSCPTQSVYFRARPGLLRALPLKASLKHTLLRCDRPGRRSHRQPPMSFFVDYAVEFSGHGKPIMLDFPSRHLSEPSLGLKPQCSSPVYRIASSVVTPHSMPRMRLSTMPKSGRGPASPRILPLHPLRLSLSP